jgi:hypothetical protein
MTTFFRNLFQQPQQKVDISTSPDENKSNNHNGQILSGQQQNDNFIFEEIDFR